MIVLQEGYGDEDGYWVREVPLIGAIWVGNLVLATANEAAASKRGDVGNEHYATIQLYLPI
jgi:hypothetical protein